MRFGLTYSGVRRTWFVRQGGYIFVIDRQYLATADGEVRDYMIVGRLGKHPLGFLIAPVDAGCHVLVQHAGFARHPGIPEVSAEITDCYAGRIRSTTLLPGTVEHVVRITCNAKAGQSAPIKTHQHLESIVRSDRYEPSALVRNPTPGHQQPKAWYTQAILLPKPGSCYVEAGSNEACGLPSPEETLL